MKKLFSLLTIALLTLTAWADTTVTMDFTAQGYTNSQAIESLTVNDVTATFAKGTNSNAPKYYDTGNAIRLYGGNTMTITAPANLKSIEFTFGSGEGSNDILSTPGNYVKANQTWTIGSDDASTSVVFTIDGSTGHRRVQKLVITMEGGETPPDPEDKVADPVFDPASGNWAFGTSHEVTISCATENASIALYKVTEDPDNPEYVDFFFPPQNGGITTGTLYVTEENAGTYFAMAYKNGMEDSDTTFATYTFYKPTCKKPTFTPANGTPFLEGEMITVTINCATEDATITYTVNDDIFEGTAPVSVPVSQTTTITAVASKEGYNDSEEATATYTMVNPVEEGPIYTLVTDITDLAAGDHIILVNSKEDGAAVAMAGSRGNNFGGVNVAVRNGQVQTNQANIITLEANGDNWNLKTADGYIYAASSTSNQMKLKDEVDANGNANAAITIGEDITTIIFQGQNTRNEVRYNPNNGTPIFSCYASTSDLGTPYIYKTVEEILEVAAPVFNPETNTTFIGSQQITLSCVTPGAVIYYGFDNENWTEYTGPFTIDESCTVYAYAAVGDAHSTVAQAKYYKANTVANIAEALALEEGNVDFQFTGEAIVTYQNGQNTWIKDATGYGLIYGTVPEMTTGTVISDGWTAYLTDYYGVPEFASPKNVEASEDVVTVEPEVKETVTNDDVNMYLIMKNQTLTADQDNNNTWLNADGLKFFKKFNDVELPTFEEGKTYDVVGVVTIYHNAPEVYIISATEVQAPVGLRGDVNLDEQVNIQDVTALINYILSKNADGISLENANCNHDDQINIQDVTTLINYILSKNWPAE